MQIMVDLETFGNAAGCVVASIGAVPFDPHKGVVREDQAFYQVLSLQPQLDAGMVVHGSTLLWWLKQSDQARARLSNGADEHPSYVSKLFCDYYRDVGGEAIWGHGLNFDMPILEHLLRTFGCKAPWHYQTGRDTRTLFDLAGRKMGSFGTPNALAHDALSDAIYQAYETMHCINHLRGVRIAASAPTEAIPATNGDIR